MSRYINADKLYEMFLKLERDALDECLKYDASDKRFGVWSIILNERTSYKYDVQDFPDIEIVHCRDCARGEILGDEVFCHANGNACPFDWYCAGGIKKCTDSLMQKK